MNCTSSLVEPEEGVVENWFIASLPEVRWQPGLLIGLWNPRQGLLESTVYCIWWVSYTGEQPGLVTWQKCRARGGLVGLNPFSLWDLMLSLGRNCQNWVEFWDTQWVPKHCLMVWGKHSFPTYCNCDKGYIYGFIIACVSSILNCVT